MSAKHSLKKQRRINIVVDERLHSKLEAAQGRTGLGLPEMGRMGLIKIICELEKVGKIVADALPDEPSAA